jgi:hypothetical protein
VSSIDGAYIKNCFFGTRKTIAQRLSIESANSRRSNSQTIRFYFFIFFLYGIHTHTHTRKKEEEEEAIAMQQFV